MIGHLKSNSKIHLVFNQYLRKSLKETTRDKITKETTIHYHVNDTTELKNVKTILSNNKTKGELTEYLAEKIL